MKSHTAPLVPTSPSPTVLWVPGDARAELGWEADWVVAYLPCVPESGQAPTCDCPRADAHPSGSGMPTGGDAQSGVSVPRFRGDGARLGSGLGGRQSLVRSRVTATSRHLLWPAQVKWTPRAGLLGPRCCAHRSSL